MGRSSRTGRILGFLCVAAVLVALALPAFRAYLWRRELNPVLRGRLLAERQGCLNCHRPDAGREIPNQGSRWGSIPRFQAGNALMYGPSREEIEEFIRFGAPQAWLDDGKARARLESQSIRMPAYDGRLSGEEIEALVEFVSAVEGVELRGGEIAEKGRKIAREHGCLSCHGIEGSGGLPNPGSLGGFVPGFLGSNFAELVKDRQEFDEWILDGTNTRLLGNPVVRRFWRRQRISMPAYRDLLDDDEIDALWVWVEVARDDR